MERADFEVDGGGGNSTSSEFFTPTRLEAPKAVASSGLFRCPSALPSLPPRWTMNNGSTSKNE
jgi:hypothetical protein